MDRRSLASGLLKELCECRDPIRRQRMHIRTPLLLARLMYRHSGGVGSESVQLSVIHIRIPRKPGGPR